MSARKPSLVFVCVANSCRSQMAEAIAKSLAGDRADIWSAGSQPGGRIHPLAIQMLKEIGLGVDGQRSKGLADLPPRRWDYVVTMGCGDACPSLAAAHWLDWAIQDPVALTPEQARRVRDDLRRQVEALLQDALSRR